MKLSTAVLLIIVLLSCPGMGGDRSSAIDRVVVSVFEAKTKSPGLRKKWNKKKVKFQQEFIRKLNRQSYLEVVGTKARLKLKTKSKVLKKTARKKGVDGVIVGAYNGQTIEMALRSGKTGRNLATWSIPVDPQKKSYADVLELATQSIVTGFPYRGFVLRVRRGKVTLNLGKRYSVKPGTVLRVFEFDGKKPTFSSPQKTIGEVVVLKAKNDTAIAKIKKGKKQIKTFSKVGFAPVDVVWENKLETRTHYGFWIGLGTEFFFLDTQVSDLTNDLSKRVYQIPVSPFPIAEIGYGPVRISASTGSASNSSNNVRFTKGEATLELLSFGGSKWGYIASIGAQYTNYAVEVLSGATFPLIATTSLAPVIELRAQRLLGGTSLWWYAGKLLYPVMASDADNGSSSQFASMGLNLETGVRMDLASMVAIEMGLKAQAVRQGYQNGDLIETQYGIFIRGLGLF